MGTMRLRGMGLLLGLATVALVGCATCPDEAAKGTTARSKDEAMRSSLAPLSQHCDWFLGCNCSIDGNRTSCALVSACLRSGNCVLERAN